MAPQKTSWVNKSRPFSTAKSNVYVYGQPGEGKVGGGMTEGADHGCGQETHPGSDPPIETKHDEIISGQIIATSHDLTPNGSWEREPPFFQ